MSRCIPLLLICFGTSFGQNCIEYGTSTTLAGRLFVKDESGYNQFIALELSGPVCTTPDPRKGLEWERGEVGVRVIQAGVYGSDSASEALHDRLARLVGFKVTIRGIVFPAQTGYHRTDVQFGVEQVEPVDAAGQRALAAPAVKFKPKDVPAYDVTITAASRLTILARDNSSRSPLTPAEKYVPHWMTGGEVVYVNCLDGYERRDSIGCADDDLCGFSAFPVKPQTIRFRCVKQP